MSAVLDLFLELAAILSPPGEERAVADRVLERLRAIGLEPDEDGAGAAIGSSIGNIYACLPATVEGTPIFLNAHLDTVPPTAAVVPEVRNGIVVNAEQTILGADNKAAVAAMLAAVEQVVAEGIDHAGIELVLTPMEEVGCAAPRSSTTAAARAVRLLLRPRRADRQHRRGGAHPEDSEAQVPRPRCAFGHRPGGGPKCDRRRGAGDRRHAAGPDRCRHHGQRGPDPRWHRRKHRAARVHRVGRAAFARPGDVAALAREMLDAATHAANLYDCELESTISSEYEGYRFTRTHPAVQLAMAALEAAATRRC